MMQFDHNQILFREIANLSLEINDAAYVYLDSEWRSPQARSFLTRLYFVTKGSAEIISCGRSYTLRPGTIYMIPSGTDFCYRCDGTLEKLYFHLRLLRYDRTDCLGRAGGCVMLENQAGRITEIVRLFRSTEALDALRLRIELYAVLCEMLQKGNVRLERIEKYSRLVTDAMDLIDRNLRCTLTAAELAEALSVSVFHLQKTFKREVGVPLGRYIHMQVMHRAELLLRSRNYTVKEISAQLGFCDQFYFSRCFTQMYGIPPSRYKDML